MNSGEREAFRAFKVAPYAEKLEPCPHSFALSPTGQSYASPHLEAEYPLFCAGYRAALSTRTQPATGDAAREILARELGALPVKDLLAQEWLRRLAHDNFSSAQSAALRAIESALRSPGGEEWQTIQPIPAEMKDGRYLLAEVGGATDRWEHLNGRAFVIRHEGKTESGYDLGWALFPGFGGVSDSWFSRWMPLPALDHGKVEA